MASDQLPPVKPQPSCNGLEDTRSGAGTQLHLEVAFKADCDAAGLPASLLCHADGRRGFAVTAFQSPVDAMLLHDQPRQLEEGLQLPLAWDIHRLTLRLRIRLLRRVHSTDRGSATHLSTGTWCPTYEKCRAASRQAPTPSSSLDSNPSKPLKTLHLQKRFAENFLSP